MNEYAKPTVRSNFTHEGNFYINGSIDDSIAESIIAPLIKRIETEITCSNKNPIKVYITSYGGYVKEAYDIVSHFEYAKKKGIEIHTYVTSVAFSAGSLIAVAGHKRFVSQRAHHGLHFARGTEYAHNPEMADRNAENLKWIMAESISIYKKYTKLKNIEKLLLPDNYMINGGAELIRLGLADEIL